MIIDQLVYLIYNEIKILGGECMLDEIYNFIKKFRKYWGFILSFLICGSLIALFIASFCMDKVVTLSIMNEWVSLIVGILALALSVISLFLSFYNVEQSNEVQKETINIMEKLKSDIFKELEKNKREMLINVNDIPDLTVKALSYEVSNSSYKWKNKES